MLEPIPFAGYVEIPDDMTDEEITNLLCHQQAEIEMLKKLLNDFGITVTKKAQDK